ncbi:MAG: tRNA (adenosine(37)-N6)-dimethylallyltransferase MiaA [Chloroflexi bacterium]|nr:tRNA (adenosine(37)-N6)-dimethylallyltransferase MiaA [Chloroflexota bacterium]MYA93237.1 tRNA (adenosine(37)-N6)-dimethylallyltransferase MiaA [Chloroflexota bacterium]MYC55422.1 tRNA (adenosine(37)-N6)-dimethylallyltransferase MiaA [Chloroflexota bacterium]MYD38544.1 tRNA (adenosine(37)-N6)-dimethylallyltransferase MiaA [Chloroflexota bacterium]MYH64196.1 tRNA (adenosine(37)-N6)-dimethylallyltransferase MiaA [Chloroflexota bacterium]
MRMASTPKILGALMSSPSRWQQTARRQSPMWRTPLTGKAPLLILLGATGVGKTRLAIQLARRLEGEIIGADSRQIYRYMDIGTAKPSPAQQALAPHHLINMVAPDHNLSLAEYQDAANRVIADCQRRGKLPMLVGGSGQYISAVEEGWSIPRVPPDANLRAELETFAEQHSPVALHERLRQVDPAAAESIHPNNIRRVIRALEVQMLTGAPISQLQIKRPPPWHIFRLGLQLPREILYPRVDARVDAMIAAGFVEEVARLLEMGFHRRLPSMSGLGYGELAAHLLDGIALDKAIERTKFRTHDFIRRQDVWFRGHDNGTVWHNAAQVDVGELAARLADYFKQAVDTDDR